MTKMKQTYLKPTNSKCAMLSIPMCIVFIVSIFFYDKKKTTAYFFVLPRERETITLKKVFTFLFSSFA